MASLVLFFLVVSFFCFLYDTFIYKTKQIHSLEKKIKSIRDSYEKTLSATIHEKEKEIESKTTELNNLRSLLSSNLSSIPYMARIVSDFDTRGLDILAQQLNWGTDQKRLKKVKSIQEIKKETAAQIAQYKEAEYQLNYAIQMFPALEDFLNTEYSSLDSITISDIQSENHDSVRNYLSNSEYNSLSSAERNQLALDRYVESHRKSNWQIGRDYELYVGYRYSLKGYSIEYHGIENGLEDLGRDLIAKKDDITLVIQCKYWSSVKQIHEKHITQLYGTTVCYCFEHNLPLEKVNGILVTNISASDTAKKFAKFLNIEIVENFSLGDFPRIKCNINKDTNGETSYIYHLPFDQQYDSCKIDRPGEFMALTVAEAENAGFRRAYRWHGTEQ